MQFIRYNLQNTELNTSESFTDFSLSDTNAWTEKLPDPLKLKDMVNICETLEFALASQKRILIYGDYDLDGMSAASALYRTLLKLRAAFWQKKHDNNLSLTQLIESLNQNEAALLATTNFADTVLKNDTYQLAVYIPDRLMEGYSISDQAVDYILEQAYELVITVDCGVKSYTQVAKLESAKVEVIITDHHECFESLPEARFVLNPKRLDEKYTNRDLSGSAVVFKLAQALEKTLNLPTSSLTYPILEIAFLGLVSDVMPLNFENWQIIRAAFNKLRKERGQIGLASLLERQNIKRNHISYNDIAFYICPKFNACGRIGDAYLGLRCLVTADAKQAEAYADALMQLNSERQAMTKKLCQAADEYLYEQTELLLKPILCVTLQEAHSGIVGLVAAYLQAKYLKPSICFTSIVSDNGELQLKGSGRSYGNFNLYTALAKLQIAHPDLFVAFGGHKEAVGLTIPQAKLAEFNCLLNVDVSQDLPTVSDVVYVTYTKKINLSGKESNLPTVDELKERSYAEPFGPKRPLPLYLYSDKITDSSYLGQSRQHVKLQLATGESLLAFNKPILANLAKLAMPYLHLLVEANLHEFRQVEQAQYLVKSVYLAWTENSLIERQQSKALIKDLKELSGEQIYTILALLYKILTTYSESKLIYLNAVYFGVSYFPILAATLCQKWTELLLSSIALKQSLQILVELNIIKYYQLTAETLLIKLLDSNGQKYSLSDSVTFRALTAES